MEYLYMCSNVCILHMEGRILHSSISFHCRFETRSLNEFRPLWFIEISWPFIPKDPFFSTPCIHKGVVHSTSDPPALIYQCSHLFGPIIYLYNISWEEYQYLKATVAILTLLTCKIKIFWIWVCSKLGLYITKIN